ncbi:M15 family metallopeptidase [Vibrio hepatarius]|uniref:M15 family metallopeptidase n=1 Tax=Vibrio hepatarius TaxID=171383 RepID=UPI0037361A66
MMRWIVFLMAIAGGAAWVSMRKTGGRAMTSTNKPKPVYDWVFGARSKRKLAPVHTDLQKVTHRALELSPFDFGVTHGFRTAEQQNALFKQNTPEKWVTDKDGYVRKSRHQSGLAIDIAVYDEDGNLTWGWSYYEQVSWAFKQAANELGVSIVWGGDWPKRKDGVHIELNQEVYG